jgi:putative membrane protein
MSTAAPRQETKSKFLINVISIVVPLAVAVMFGFTNKFSFGDWTKVLPHFIGAINSLTTLVLIAGFIFIKRGKVELHRAAMTTAFALGGLFLICYVTYHISNPANKFGGEGAIRYVYFFFLITHIGLSLVVLPLVLRAMFFAVTGQFARHKNLAKYAYPIWFYVSGTGVIVYLLLYQLFPTN